MFALVVVLAALLPGLAPAAGTHARVWLARESPLVVRGESFKPHERVVVTLTSRTRFVKTVTATAAGTILAHWTGAAAMSTNGCVYFQIRAAGNRGTVASLKSSAKGCPTGMPFPSE